MSYCLQTIRKHQTGENKMPDVRVVPADKGKSKVLVNGVQQGVAYSSEVQAEHEASKIRDRYEKIYGGKK